MKKVSAIFLLNFYALAVFGIATRQFYCCGVLKSTNIILTDISKEKCRNGDENDGCCKVEYKSFKVKEGHFAAGEVITPSKQFVDLHLFTPSLEIAFESEQPKTITNLSHAPPLQRDSKLYILNCVYRI